MAVALATAAGTVRAQIEQAQTFDVASVRLARFDVGTSVVTDSRVDLRTRLLNVLWMAFRIEPFCCADRLIAPNWLRDVNVAIQATIPAGGTRQQVPEMLQALLIQRFGLRMHVEARPTDGYELSVGKDGIRMKEVEAANELDRVFPADSSERPFRDSVLETVDGPVRTMSLPRGLRTITERTMYDRTGKDGGTFQYDAARMTMSELASILTLHTGRPVIDRTKLTGVYSFSIELPVPPFAGRGLATSGPATTFSGTPINQPSFAAAFASAVKAAEQLGLKLEPRRLPIDTIVVDKIERVPTDN
jgi:uncharacterized protein (TIGR03435 family)